MSVDRKYRLAVASRVLAGFGGGYVLTSLIVATLSLALPGGQASVVLSSTMAGFLIYAIIIMAAFHARSAIRAWLWIMAPSIPLAVLLAFMLSGGSGE